MFSWTEEGDAPRGLPHPANAPAYLLTDPSAEEEEKPKGRCCFLQTNWENRNMYGRWLCTKMTLRHNMQIPNLFSEGGSSSNQSDILKKQSNIVIRVINIHLGITRGLTVRTLGEIDRNIEGQTMSQS